MKKMRFVLFFFACTAALTCKDRQPQTSQSKFYGSSGVFYGEIYFAGEVFVPSETNDEMVPAKITDTKAIALAQLKFMAGAMMRYGTYKRFPGALTGRYSLVIEPKPLTTTSAGTTWRYYFRTMANFRSHNLHPEIINEEQDENSPIAKIWPTQYKAVKRGEVEVYRGSELILPLDPQTIYEATLAKEPVAKDAKPRNLCVDPEHDIGAKSFYYYWEPEREGCPILQNPALFTKISPILTTMPQTKDTYPDYPNMYGDPQIEVEAGSPPKEVRFSWLFGKIGKEVTLKEAKTKPLKDDTNVRSVASLTDFLVKEMGFKIESKRQKTYKEVFGDKKTYPYPNEIYSIETLLSLSFQRPHIVIHFRLFYGAEPSDLDNEFKIETPRSHLFIFDGHSRLGGISSFTGMLHEIKFDPDMFQIFFIAGCRSFAYYNGTFLDSKPKALNVLTNTNETIGVVNQIAIRTLLKQITSFDKGPLPSWQTIVDSMNKAETDYLLEKKMLVPGEDESNLSLISINGDETNVPYTEGTDYR